MQNNSPKAVLIALATCILTVSPAFAEFRIIHQGDSGKIVIFVHGLWGDPLGSFSADANTPSWPELMGKDAESVRDQLPLARYTIAVLGYPASRAATLSLPQVAPNLSNELTDAGVFDKYREIYFIAHSLGGLIVKEMLVTASVARQPLASRTKAVFLISSPASGAPGAAFLARLPEFVTGRLVQDLKTIDINSYLQQLANNWQTFMRSTQLSVFCAYETQATAGIAVVPQQYSDVFCTENPRAENANHINIVKPRGHDAEIYKWVRGRLAALAVSGSVTPQPIEETRLKATIAAHQGSVGSIVVTTDGRWAISAGDDGVVRVWDMIRFVKFNEFKGGDFPATAVDVSNRLKRIAATFSDGTVRVWSMETWNAEPILTVTNEPIKRIQLALSPLTNDISMFGLRPDGTIREWAFTADSMTKVHDYNVNAKAFVLYRAPRLAPVLALGFVRDRSAHLMLASRHEYADFQKFLENTMLIGHDAEINDIKVISVTPNQYAFTASDDSTIRMWDYYNASFIHSFVGHFGPVRVLAVVGGGEGLMFASGGDDKTVRIWDGVDRKLVKELGNHAAGITSVVFSSDGRSLISGSKDGVIKIWNVGDLSFKSLVSSGKARRP